MPCKSLSVRVPHSSRLSGFAVNLSSALPPTLNSQLSTLNHAERLVLRRGRHLSRRSQVAQKSFHLEHPHFPRVALAMEEYEPFDPLPIRALCSQRVVL